MYVSKRELGMNYVVGTGVVLSGVLLADLILESASEIPVWTGVGLVPALLLVSAVYWLPRSGLDGEGIWAVAQCGALGLGTVTLFATVLLLGVEVVQGAEAMTVVLASNVATGTVVGVLGGLAWQLHATVDRVRVRNTVLNRVLRHNVRNDMTVVLGHLDELAEDVDATDHPEIAIIERKIEAFLSLTEKIHRVDTALDCRGETRQAVDVVSVLREGVVPIQETRSEVDVSTDCPSVAWAHADGLLGTVLTDVIESALARSETDLRLAVEIERTPEWVTIRIDDVAGAIPRQDLAVVEDGAETKLNHGTGVDLWLLDWLVRDYGGRLDIETADGHSVVEIGLRRADHPRQSQS